jgi:hypothetical protein
MTEWTCLYHGGQYFAGDVSCPECVAALSKDVSVMDPGERAAEVRWWAENVLTVPFADLHKRIEDLVGRPVWTHELANPDLLAKEIETGCQSSLQDVLDKFPVDKPVIVVEMP